MGISVHFTWSLCAGREHTECIRCDFTWTLNQQSSTLPESRLTLSVQGSVTASDKCSYFQNLAEKMSKLCPLRQTNHELLNEASLIHNIYEIKSIYFKSKCQCHFTNGIVMRLPWQLITNLSQKFCVTLLRFFWVF